MDVTAFGICGRQRLSHCDKGVVSDSRNNDNMGDHVMKCNKEFRRLNVSLVNFN